MHKSFLIAGLFLATTSVSSLADVITIPAGLGPGDSYRLAFLTTGITAATSTNIDFYNDFVDSAAESVPELAALGHDWKVIGSTAAVSARQNTGTDPTAAGPTGVPIFLLNGVQLADNYDDLWDGTVDTPLNVFETGDPATGQPLVWTGTQSNGLGFTGRTLGTTRPRQGVRLAGLHWIDDRNDFNNSTAFRLYGMSDLLTVPTAVPEPGGVAVLSMLAVFGVAMRRRNRCAGSRN